MTISFSNVFSRWIIVLSMHPTVKDRFFNLRDPPNPDDLLEELLCTELFALQKRFDVMVPFRTAFETDLTRKYPKEVLQKHFGVLFMMPDKDAVMFTDKAFFHQWLLANGLTAFTPTVYGSKFEVAYPCLVKGTSGIYGEGIHVVRSIAELEVAITRINGKYILQEALEGKIEPIVHFVASSGKLLATSCVLDRKQSSQLFVTGYAHDLAPTDTVSCASFDHISPLSDLVRYIIRVTKYDGFGCFNFKFVPRKMSREQLEAYLQNIPTIDHTDARAVYTHFGREGARHDFAHAAATPKLYDFNTRQCGSHTRDQTLELYKMLRMYLEAVAVYS